MNKLPLVIPAKAGGDFQQRMPVIKRLREVVESLDPGLRRDDGLFGHSLGAK
ncbi:MAG: hypothetical protein KGJ97_04360 [Xanthomonadaceae bacterium]|nr:hypothetical protein [Xanthomonadaceae bacterium]MDE3071753.1 hypothetical protein [Pseudomonadota bacterium]